MRGRLRSLVAMSSGVDELSWNADILTEPPKNIPNVPVVVEPASVLQREECRGAGSRPREIRSGPTRFPTGFSAG